MFTGTCLPPPFPALKGLSWVGSPSVRPNGNSGLSGCISVVLQAFWGSWPAERAKGLLI